MRRYSILSLAIIALLAFTASLYAYPHNHGKGMYKKDWWENEQFVKELQLTDEQVTKIKEIDESYDSKFESMHNKLMESYKSYKQSMSDPKATDAQITATHDEMLSSKNELKKLKLEKKLKIRNILSGEQITKLSEMNKMQKKDCDHDDCDEDCKKKCDRDGKKKQCSQKDK